MSNQTLQRLAGALISGMLVLAALTAPVAALAADPTEPIEAQPTDAQPTDAQATQVLDDGFDGEIVYDPYFISPEPDATPETAPLAAVRGGAGGPQLTPPPTDTPGVEPDRQGAKDVPLLLVGLSAFSITVLALGRAPAVRRR